MLIQPGLYLGIPSSGCVLPSPLFWEGVLEPTCKDTPGFGDNLVVQAQFFSWQLEDFGKLLCK